jgi:hypothetical protein
MDQFEYEEVASVQHHSLEILRGRGVPHTDVL